VHYLLGQPHNTCGSWQEKTGGGEGTERLKKLFQNKMLQFLSKSGRRDAETAPNSAHLSRNVIDPAVLLSD